MIASKIEKSKQPWAGGAGLIVLRSVHPEARPVGSVIPVDAVAVGADRSPNRVSIPVRRQGALSVDLSACVAALLVAQLQIIAALPDRAGLGPIPLGVPRPSQVQPIMPAAASARVASCPERSVRPVDLAAVRAEVAGRELPSRGDNARLSLELPRGGVAIFVG